MDLQEIGIPMLIVDVLCRASTRKASTSVPEGVPEQVIELDSPPSSDHDESSHHDESASHHDDGLRTPARGGSPSKGDEFLTPGGAFPPLTGVIVVVSKEGNHLGVQVRMMRRCLVTRRRVVLLLARTSVLRVAPEFQRMVLRAIILTRSRRGGMAGVLLWRTRMLAEGRLGCLKFIPAWGFRVRSSPLGPISTKLLNIILCLAGSSPRWSRSTRRRFGQLRTKPLCCGGAGDGQDVDTMVADLQQDKLVLESKVAALNREIVKTLGLQEVADKLRAQVSDLEEKARRDAEASAAEMERLRRSRRESVEAAVTQVFDSVNDWYAPRLHRLSEFVAQRDMVEAAVGRRQVDEALLNFREEDSGSGSELRRDGGEARG
ncbi:unnamed protein product [Microthlaspi erraticum]|uniref:Uncharacterized protein n=1 Tax=Microthlaspi erraticum TaxID=1685480 RepID=A0A6D2IVX6_9BRAS|nr:unnamed protein product [Microthlaspi erraticum]